MDPKLTPMMKQYLEIKKKYPREILFFRLGDFYEMFFEDAHTASRLLDIALTTRDREANIPMCGVPVHARQPSWSPDGSKIAFVSDRLGSPQIFIMNSDGSGVRRLTRSGTYNVNPSWSPKGDRILYSRQHPGGFQIHSISPDGSDDTQLTTQGRNENPRWSPDGRFITFGSNRGGKEAIYVMRADGSSQIKVSRSGGGDSQPVWSSRR